MHAGCPVLLAKHHRRSKAVTCAIPRDESASFSTTISGPLSSPGIESTSCSMTQRLCLRHAFILKISPHSWWLHTCRFRYAYLVSGAETINLKKKQQQIMKLFGNIGSSVVSHTDAYCNTRMQATCFLFTLLFFTFCVCCFSWLFNKGQVVCHFQTCLSHF